MKFDLARRASKDTPLRKVGAVSSAAAVVALYGNPPWKHPCWWRGLSLLSGAVVENTTVTHVGKIGVLALLLKVDGVGVLGRLLYIGEEGGLLARVRHVEGIGVRVLDVGDVGTDIVGLLLSLYFALGVAVSGGPVERTPPGPAFADTSCLLR